MHTWSENARVDVHARRLVPGERALARDLFTVMAGVFGEPSADLSDAYLDHLLQRPDFWAVAAMVGDEVAGGITAHALPMTRTESSELFIYDVAVREEYQRRGVGRLMMTALRTAAAVAGIAVAFVPADDDDAHAQEFYRALGGAPAPVTFFTFSDAVE
ncbi:MAG: GNAT family N-acetyltransferase [bacterium]